MLQEKRWYCGWKKSCTTLDGWNPIHHGVNHRSTGDSDFFHPQVPPAKLMCCSYVCQLSYRLGLPPSPILLMATVTPCAFDSPLTVNTPSTVMMGKIVLDRVRVLITQKSSEYARSICVLYSLYRHIHTHMYLYIYICIWCTSMYVFIPYARVLVHLYDIFGSYSFQCGIWSQYSKTMFHIKIGSWVVKQKRFRNSVEPCQNRWVNMVGHRYPQVSSSMAS